MKFSGVNTVLCGVVQKLSLVLVLKKERNSECFINQEIFENSNFQGKVWEHDWKKLQDKEFVWKNLSSDLQ